jgi:hypothetical protein
METGGSMRIKYLLAVGLIALFALPGTASQLAARAAAASPQAAGGAFSDPDIAPNFSITLPVVFSAPTFDTPLQHFAG